MPNLRVTGPLVLGTGTAFPRDGERPPVQGTGAHLPSDGNPFLGNWNPFPGKEASFPKAGYPFDECPLPLYTEERGAAARVGLLCGRKTLCRERVQLFRGTVPLF